MTTDYTNYQTVGNYDSGAVVAAGMFGGLFILFYIIVIALMLVSMWKIFVKAGKAGWASLVPIYNTIVMLEIAKLPFWYIFLMFVPIVNIVIGVIVAVKIAKAFGKEKGFVLGMLFLPLIFYPILAFGKSEYIIEG